MSSSVTENKSLHIAASCWTFIDIVEDIKIRRLEWAGHIIRMEEERIPKKDSKWKLPYHKTSGKTKN